MSSSLSNNERDKLYFPMFVCSFLLLFLTVYWFGFPLFSAYGLNIIFLDDLLAGGGDERVFRNPLYLKLLTLAFVVLNTIVRSGAPTRLEWRDIWTRFIIGAVLFFFPFRHCVPFVLCTIVGYILLINAIALIGRKIKGIKDPANDRYETFEQCEEKLETEYSINIPTVYQYKYKKRHGWINVVNPFRATMVLGTPGSGKSFSVYNPFISQMMAKAYTCFVYDYKFPDLTEEIYNEYLDNIDNFKRKLGKVPRFCVINFDDPRYSLRCNPIHPRYITDPADTSEIADIIMRNVNPQSVEKEDFFTLSAKVYIDALIWYLRIYKDGEYCTFPHLIELMGRNYKAVFKILSKYDEIRVKIQPFQNALQGNAQEQLQGQIASAQIPLLRFASPSLYWVLSGDDFSLDVNDKEDPKIVCIGNNPDRQSIYGTTLALYTSRMFKQINHKGKFPCGVLFDEFPTIYVKGIDNLIATARSNKVAIVLGAQDESQIRRDYGDKESEVVFNTVGNLFAGQVNGRTAKSLSETFGREFREQQSETSGDSSSVSRSFQQQEILPQSTIETLSQGYFFGKVADNNDCKIDRKLFCGEIQIDLEERKRKMARRRKIEQMPSRVFNDQIVAERVRMNEDAYVHDYVRDDIRKEDREKRLAGMDVTDAEGDNVEEMEIRARIKAMSSKERDRYVQDIISKEQRKEVDRILKENYEKIKSDILGIFNDEDVPEFDDDGSSGTMSSSGGTDGFDDPTASNPYTFSSLDDAAGGTQRGGGTDGTRPSSGIDLTGMGIDDIDLDEPKLGEQMDDIL